MIEGSDASANVVDAYNSTPFIITVPSSDASKYTVLLDDYRKEIISEMATVREKARITQTTLSSK